MTKRSGAHHNQGDRRHRFLCHETKNMSLPRMWMDISIQDPFRSTSNYYIYISYKQKPRDRLPCLIIAKHRMILLSFSSFSVAFQFSNSSGCSYIRGTFQEKIPANLHFPLLEPWYLWQIFCIAQQRDQTPLTCWSKWMSSVKLRCPFWISF